MVHVRRSVVTLSIRKMLTEEELKRVEARLAKLLGESTLSTTDLADYASRELVRLIAAVRAERKRTLVAA